MGLLEYISSIPGIMPRRHGRNARSGIEYACACPFPGCAGGGKSTHPDRFVFWPDADGGKGRFFCRGTCGKSGDGIKLVQELTGAGFVSACHALDLPIPAKYRKQMEEARKRSPEEWRRYRAKRKVAAQITPSVDITQAIASDSEPVAEETARLLQQYHIPPEKWLERAARLVNESEARLESQPAVIKWLADRGISLDAAQKARLGWNDKPIYRPLEAWGLPRELKSNGRPRMMWVPAGLVIPVFDQATGSPVRIKVRRTRKDLSQNGGNKYHALRGSSSMPLITNPAAPAQIIVEAELDAFCMGSIFPDICGGIGLGSLSIMPDRALFQRLGSCMDLILCLDAEETKIMERTIRKWQELYPDIIIAPVPAGKDPGEAAQAGFDLAGHISRHLCPALQLRIQPGCGSVSPASNFEQGNGDISFPDNEKKSSERNGRKGEKVDVPSNIVEVPENIKAVCDFLGALKLRLHVTPQGIELKGRPRQWDQQCWDDFSRLSDLIFHTPDVYELLSGLSMGRYGAIALERSIRSCLGGKRSHGEIQQKKRQSVQGVDGQGDVLTKSVAS